MNAIQNIAFIIISIIIGTFVYRWLTDRWWEDKKLNYMIFVDVDSTEWHFKWITETVGKYRPLQPGLVIEVNHNNIPRGGFAISIKGRPNKEARRLWEYLCQTNHRIDHKLILVHDINGEEVDIQEFLNVD